MSGSIERDKYDDMMVDIDSRLFDVQSLLSRFVMELMAEFHEGAVAVNIAVPFISDDKVSMKQLQQAVFRSDNYPPLHFEDDKGSFISWSDFDVASQYILANYLHSIHVQLKFNLHFRRNDQ